MNPYTNSAEASLREETLQMPYYQETGYPAGSASDSGADRYGSGEKEKDTRRFPWHRRRPDVPDSVNLTAADEEEAEEYGVRAYLKNWLISQAILLSGVLILYLVRGRELVLRMLPVYVIIAVCLSLYYLVDFVLKRRKAAKENGYR